MCNPGYIYLLVNYSFPALVKIGKTRRSPAERAAELSAATGVPTPFVVITSILVSDCDFAESLAHEKLGQYRVNNSREFFAVPIEVANGVIFQISKTLLPTAVQAMQVHAYEFASKSTRDDVAGEFDEVEEDLTEGEGYDDEKLYQKAMGVLRATKRALTSTLQRRLGIGYNRAARIMDLMEERGVVGPENGSSPREILVDLDKL